MIQGFIRWIGLLTCMLLLAGCRTQAAKPIAPSFIDLNAEISRAGQTGKSLVVLIGEFGTGGADFAHRDLLNEPYAKQSSDGIQLLTIDLKNSRNRATAARYHLVKTPVIVCLSPRGIIVSRDVGWENAETILASRIQDLPTRAAQVDKEFDLLWTGTNAAATNPHVASFLLEHQNDLEAIPYLTAIANSRTAGVTEQIDARVEIARAHLWIGEPEKARHEAKQLIANLGASYPPAMAGGNLILGLQDIAAKRFTLANAEFEAAASAAPDSIYARQATAELAKLAKKMP